MKTAQLPAMPDYSKPVECRGSELSAVIAQAQAAGFHCHRMTVADQVVYRLQFWRLDAPQATPEGNAPPPSKESFFNLDKFGGLVSSPWTRCK
ncbi:MAG: hypothetical protein PHY43_14815 [Verrucomicrobiales bacterium]|nr:hypothetical protein [Verrucomicrobiales bacterium]